MPQLALPTAFTIRLFGTYEDADAFAPACGFPRDNERYLADMLLFRDVYDRGARKS